MSRSETLPKVGRKTRVPYLANNLTAKEKKSLLNQRASLTKEINSLRRKLTKIDKRLKWNDPLWKKTQ